MKTLAIGLAVAIVSAYLLYAVIVPCICPFKSPSLCAIYCGAGS